jgi:Phage integrase, N-terminal SAM-like domain
MMVERGKLWSEVCSFYGQALAPNTRQQYGSHVRWFAAFCVANGADFLKPTEAEVMMYCAFQAREVKYTTVIQYLKGLKSFYAQRRLPGIKSAEEWPHLYRMLKGIRRVKGGGTAPKAPVTPAMLVALRRNFDVSLPYGAALWACVLVTFFGFFPQEQHNDESQLASLGQVAACRRHRGRLQEVLPQGQSPCDQNDTIRRARTCRLDPG